ncbi:RagB/SusD family nutrient uptake outer membrane protein [Porphyromonas sp.]|uniref:RagB/SusD family nutrient uptake outer membrane protein n=1 Tax=Porphyromonas sp. TaxID=1924944 RepID=UPI0026DBC2FE|nr:RagB/SusD family nutrient uptake outer membrane protein [Porphyromonas sp.]MDO4770793.1 RagB/SusD family nutrient uptake outer membrane protein [Porphyromonas sp.]
MKYNILSKIRCLPKICYRFALYVSVLLCCVDCSLDLPYENQFSDPDAITSPDRARELLATAYAQLPDPSFELSVLSDDFEPTDLLPRNTELTNLYKWQPAAIEVLSLSLWQDYYNAIAIANTMLDRAALLTDLTAKEEAALRSVTAEAKVLKAYCFFNLLRLFAPDYTEGSERAGVPLKRILELEFLPRADIKTCVESIRSLLKEALESGYTSGGEYWFSPQSAYYLLAEVALYAQDYPEAVHYAEKVIEGQGGYETLNDRSYQALWTDRGCPERIYSRFIKKPYYTDISMTRAKGDYVTVNQSLMSLYSPTDIRRDATEFTYRLKDDDLSDEESKRKGFGKYNRENKEDRTFQTVTRYRVSGACFILAEAYCRSGNEGKGIEVMNEYLSRRKAELFPSKGLAGDDLLRAVLQEKWKEFLGEGGRFFDLKRLRRTTLSNWNKKEPMLATKRITEDDYRWNFPIPRREYLYNDQMIQNEGWPRIER